MVKISVIIPTYNRAHTIERAINSILAQNVADIDIETIVIDDGSTDDTLKILEKYNKKIMVIHQSNQGIGAARNNGILAAKGEYIGLLDSDDEWLPNKLRAQFEHFNVFHDVGLIGSGAIFIDQDGCIKRIHSIKRYGDLRKELLFNNIIVNSTVVIRRSVIEKHNLLFRSDLPLDEDWELWMRLSAKTKILLIRDILVRIYTSPDSISSMQTSNFRRKQYQNIIESLSYDPDLGAIIKQNNRNLQANAFFIQAFKEYFSGDIIAARKNILRGLRLFTIQRSIINLLAMMILPPRIYLKFSNRIKATSKLVLCYKQKHLANYNTLL